MITQSISSNRKLVPVTILTLALLAVLLFREPLASLLVVLQDQQAISAYVQRLGWFGPLVLAGLLVAQVFLAIIPGHALIAAGGYVYGPLVGIAITAASTIIGSQIAFWIARRYGRPLVNRLAKSKDLERWDKLGNRQGPAFFFFAFVLPIFPSDLMCYVAGLGKVSSQGFMAANIAGRLLSAITLTLIGAFGFKPPWQFWAIALGGLSTFFVTWFLYRRKPLIPHTRSEIAHAMGMWIMNAYRRICSIQICTKGMQNVPTGPKILAANHPNVSDAFLLPLLFDGNIRTVAQAKQFRTPLIGWILTHTRQIPVHRERKHEAYQEACKALAGGDTILIFPEGRLNPDHDDLKIGTGAVRMSLESGLPIVPIGIHVPQRNTWNLSGSTQPGSLRKLWQFRGKFTIHFGAPWWPGKEAAGDHQAAEAHPLTRCLMEKIYVLRDAATEESEL